MRNVTIYIAGPMSGLHLYNFPAFLRAIPVCFEHYLEDTGIAAEVFCPAYHDLSKGFDPREDLETNQVEYEDILAEDCRIIAEKVDRIYFLPGWDKSPGARKEMRVALDHGCEVAFLSEYGETYEVAHFNWNTKDVLSDLECPF